MQKAKGRLDHLRALELVQFTRAGDDAGDRLLGVPCQSGAEWLVMARFGDTLTLDGFDAVRVADIESLSSRFARRAVYVRALRSKRAQLKWLPPLDLDSTHGLLRSVQRWFSLVVIDRELVNPGAAEIGVLVRASARKYELRLLTAAARWDSQVAAFPTADITRIGFGGTYEETLAAVAGLEDPKWR